MKELERHHSVINFRKSVDRIILERLKAEVDDRLRDQQAEFRNEWIT